MSKGRSDALPEAALTADAATVSPDCVGSAAGQDPAPFELRGASGKDYAAPTPEWSMPTPTTVNSTKDGHPSGRHMIDGYRMMAAAARVSGGKYQKQMAEVYDNAALCIENEAARADRAEALLAAMGSNSVPRPTP